MGITTKAAGVLRYVNVVGVGATAARAAFDAHGVRVQLSVYRWARAALEARQQALMERDAAREVAIAAMQKRLVAVESWAVRTDGKMAILDRIIAGATRFAAALGGHGTAAVMPR